MFYLLSDAGSSCPGAGFVQHVQLFEPGSTRVLLYLPARLLLSAIVSGTRAGWISNASSFTTIRRNFTFSTRSWCVPDAGTAYFAGAPYFTGTAYFTGAP